MPHVFFRPIILVVVAAVMAGITANAQQKEQAEATKPIAYRGSFEAKVDDKGNLVISPTLIVPVTEQRQGTRTVCKTIVEPREETYTVEVGGKKVPRTRTIQVPRQVSEQVPYTYNVTVGKAETRDPLTNPKVFRTGIAVVSNHPEQFPANVRTSKNSLFVETTRDAVMANQVLTESDRRMIELGGFIVDPVEFIVVLGETYEKPSVPDETRAREWPEPPKPIAYRGSIEATVDENGNLLLKPKMNVPSREEREGLLTVCRIVTGPQEETYSVNVGGKIESRVRTVEVERQVSEQVPYTYTVTIDKPEQLDVLQNPRVYFLEPVRKSEKKGKYTTVEKIDPYVVGFEAFVPASSAKRIENSGDVLFVTSTDVARESISTLVDASRSLQRTNSPVPPIPHYIVVTGETFDYAAAAKATAGTKMNAVSEASSATVSSDTPTWPLPTEKSAWIGSLPFTQKTLNGKAMVLWFFEEGCPKCKAKWRDLNSLPLSYKGKPVVFVAVNSGNSSEVVAEYVKQNKVNAAVIADTDRQLEKLAGVGEISLANIYQATIMTPDGQLHRANANDLNAAADAAIKLVK